MGAHELPRRRLILAALVLALAAPAGAKTSFIPVPEIIADPTEGNTLGLLGVVLFLDEKDEIQYMLAPDVTYNRTKGFFPHFRFFGYPTRTRRYSVVIAKSTTIDENYEVEFSDRGFWEGRAFLLGAAEYVRDSTERFYGFGNDSLEEAESNYTRNLAFAEGTAGVWLLPYVNLAYRMQLSHFRVSRGQVDDFPFPGDFVYPGRQPDLDGTFHWAHRTALVYDSRDDMDIPHHGTLAGVYGEFADRRLGSSTSFVKFGAEWRKFLPVWRDRSIVALRTLADYVSGSADTPFWEMSSLGGRRVLRGYGSDRFIDFNRSLASAEVRTRVWSPHLFGVKLEIEVTPFLEAGQVFSHVTDSPVSDLHWVYGLGFRGVVRPQIVAFVDIGYGNEGSAIFSGVNYPF
jgi:outer membrane protein assembly factor BamA